MKFTIEVDDFWLDEEEINEALQSHICRTVVSDISASIKDKVELQISAKVKKIIGEKIELVIDNELSKLIDAGVIKPAYGEEITIIQHVRDLFEKNSGWDNPDKKLKKIAKEFGDELKLQYNNAFANKIVMNMKEQGLLKDEVVQILLEGK